MLDEDDSGIAFGYCKRIEEREHLEIFQTAPVHVYLDTDGTSQRLMSLLSLRYLLHRHPAVAAVAVVVAAVVVVAVEKVEKVAVVVLYA